MRLKDSSGWFAAGSRMLQALYLLSDGAFRLFVYISLTADRNTGRLPVAHAHLARALGKSRNSISTYLNELVRQGICVCRPAPNQHQSGEIEVADDFWPYHKQSALSFGESDENSSHPESDFVVQVRKWLLHYPIVRSSFGPADRKLAAELFRRGVSLQQLDRALLLGLARKYVSSLNSLAASPIYSLSYFLPLLDEVAHTEVSDQYWEYLRHRIKDFNAAWVDRFQPTSPGTAITVAHKSSEYLSEDQASGGD